MTITFYLEIINGEKHSWINHTVTKKEEIEWLLKNVKKILEDALDMKDIKGMKEFNKIVGHNGGRQSNPLNKRF